VAYPSEPLHEVLSTVLAGRGVAQLHLAETEKYPHVTYFFDGGSEHRADRERWELVDSPRDVATYDQKPQMSAEQVADRFERSLADDTRFVIINFANADMVGHTGSIPAAVEAVETVDRCLARVVAEVERRGGVCLITADHGNAERMLEDDGSPDTAHTTNPVPLIVTDERLHLRDGGRLADIAPTVLALLDMPAPAVMSGRSLLV
ncbi:MAG TPA: alkaline phosphatase family protein, partial [Thermoleophilia bacterium]|nr:alkaline phosphatase family protein [Thermoleophilia bacterium]